MHAIQVLLQVAHIDREVLHLRIDGEGEVLDQPVELVHLRVDSLHAFVEDQTQICLVLREVECLLLLLASLISAHELVLHMQPILRASGDRS